MGSFTVVLAYATWGAAPLLAYQALLHGLDRRAAPFLTLFALYTAAVLATAMAAHGFAMSRAEVMLPWVGTLVLSVALYLLGARKGGAGK